MKRKKGKRMVGESPVQPYYAKSPADEMGFKRLDPLAEWMVGGRRECRINVPLVSRYDWRVVAECLRGLATILDIESRRTDNRDSSSLFRVQGEVNLINRRIREHYTPIYEQLRIEQPSRGGRPRNDET
jgi:hypothetical protein